MTPKKTDKHDLPDDDTEASRHIDDMLAEEYHRDIEDDGYDD